MYDNMFFNSGPQRKRPMGYAPQPQYRRVPQQRPVSVIKTINQTQKALQKFSEARRNAKINEAKRLKAEVKQRLEAIKAKREVETLKKANWALKTAKTRENVAKVKQGAGSFFGFVKEKVQGKRVNLPSPILPKEVKK